MMPSICGVQLPIERAYPRIVGVPNIAHLCNELLEMAVNHLVGCQASQNSQEAKVQEQLLA